MKYSISYVLLFLGLFLLTYEKGVGSEHSGFKYTATSRAPNSFVDTINYEWKGGFIVLKNIYVNGQGPFRFILDNSSSYCFISSELTHLIGFNPKQKAKVSDGITEKKTLLDKIDLIIGNTLFKDVLAGSNENEEFFNPVDCNIDGIIGASVIKHGVWMLTNSCIIITNSITSINDIDEYFDEELLFGRIFFHRLKIGQTSPVVTLDLGMNYFGEISEWYLKYIREKEIITGVGRSPTRFYTNNELVDTIRRVRFEGKGVKFGPECTIKNGIFDISTEQDSLFCSLGAPFLNYFNLVLDCQRKKIYFKPIHSELDYIPDKEALLGFNVAVTDSGVVVSSIWDRSPAWQAGLNIGDKIEKINSLEMNSLVHEAPCAVYERIHITLDEEPVLELKIDGQNQLIILKKTEAFNDDVF